jgi:hypothetical protein
MNVMVGICFFEKHMSYDLPSVKTQHFHIFFWFSTDPVIENVSIIRYVVFYRGQLMQKFLFLFSLFSDFQQNFFHDVLCNSIADKYSAFKQESFLNIHRPTLYKKQRTTV